jgi:succinate dehydrogenase / fumarate reductase flavoprotein subunit
MSKKKLTYSLNYRRPKSEYKPSDELMICIRYYHKCENTQKTKIIKKSTGVKCKLKDWNSDWHKSSDRTPIKYTDPHHKKKNKILKEKVKTFDIDELYKSVKNDSFSDFLKSKLPNGPIEKKWTNHKNSINLVSPANKRNIDVIVVGTGLAGGSACATLAELGYNVKAFCFQDSPRRAHSIAAQGGINAAKNYQGDGDSIYRLFYDTVKGGDYRSREENVYRLAEVSANIIDQCVAQGVPFARDYGGLLDNRSFGGVLVSRTFYAKGQTGQQLLLGAYSAMNRQIARGKIEMYNRHEMLDVVLVNGKARGIITRNLVNGGGYGNVFYLSTNAMGSNVTAAWKAHKRGAYFANPCFTQIHPTCIPVSGDHQSKLTLMSESLRNDGRIWVPKNIKDVESIRNGSLSPTEILEENRDYFLERR